MKHVVGATLIAASLLAAPTVNARQKLTGEEQLAKLLDGRVAGDPVSCIQLSQSQDTQVIDKTALVYRVGRTLYVNRPTNADRLDSDDILVTKLYSSQLCRLDTVQLHSRSTPSMWSGFVGLQDFVPYTKPKAASAK
ncbi:MAG: hypothetical protein E2586_04420 [Novosphingobium sp.]|uniref:hypothetical protein n=1 Tax=Novosphingobium sp. TaxID=1874826 RepID=UPI0012CCE573|nr:MULTISPECIES: hypothetical protein [unclassified Novosphingobium]MPS67726.1 hypothetical protein [Novosphingobium sp.]WRT94716.1 hypothetical protein U9J33_00455 [Novosphingobium sp. RL4]